MSGGNLQYGGYAGLILKVTTGSSVCHVATALDGGLEEMVSLSVSGAGFLFYPRRRGEKKNQSLKHDETKTLSEPWQIMV